MQRGPRARKNAVAKRADRRVTRGDAPSADQGHGSAIEAVLLRTRESISYFRAPPTNIMPEILARRTIHGWNTKIFDKVATNIFFNPCWKRRALFARKTSMTRLLIRKSRLSAATAKLQSDVGKSWSQEFQNCCNLFNNSHDSVMEWHLYRCTVYVCYNTNFGVRNLEQCIMVGSCDIKWPTKKSE